MGWLSKFSQKLKISNCVNDILSASEEAIKAVDTFSESDLEKFAEKIKYFFEKWYSWPPIDEPQNSKNVDEFSGYQFKTLKLYLDSPKTNVKINGIAEWVVSSYIETRDSHHDEINNLFELFEGIVNNSITRVKK